MRLLEVRSGDTKTRREADSHSPKAMFIHSIVVFESVAG
jgi:hypothetical protein